MNQSKSFDEWVPVTAALPPSDADAALKSWLKEAQSHGSNITDDDIRRDLINTGGSQHLVRYCVRKPPARSD
jgi:hypothetical protein